MKTKLKFYKKEPSHLKRACFLLFGYSLWLAPSLLSTVHPVLCGAAYLTLSGLLLNEKCREKIMGIHKVLSSINRRFRESKEVSRAIRETMENAGLAQVSKVEKIRDGERYIEDVVEYPATTIYKDDYNYYVSFEMLFGQTTRQWESRLDAFSNALRCDVVEYSVGRGLVEMTMQHSVIPATIPYKEDNEHYLTVGFGAGGKVNWGFDESPHMLLVGQTGTGKSTFLRSLLVQFRKDWILKIVDGKYVEFTFLEDLGYSVAVSKEEFLQYVDKAQSEVDERFKLMKAKRKNNYRQLNMKPYFLLCDEFIFLVESLDAKKGKGEKESERERLYRKLIDIALRGRAAGVFLILILQRPDASFIPTVIRDNLACKVVLGGGGTALEMAFGPEHRDLPGLPKGCGYCSIDNGQIKNFSFANYDLDHFARDLREVDTAIAALEEKEISKMSESNKNNEEEGGEEAHTTELPKKLPKMAFNDCYVD